VRGGGTRGSWGRLSAPTRAGTRPSAAVAAPAPPAAAPPEMPPPAAADTAILARAATAPPPPPPPIDAPSRNASGTATQCTRRNDSPPPPEKPRAPPTAAPRRTVRGSARAVRAAPGQRRESTPAVRHLDSSAFQLRHENTRRHREIPVDGPHRSGKEEETSRAGGQFPARATARWAAPLHRTAHWLVGMGSQNCRIVGKSQPFLMIINAPPSHILAPRTRPPHPRSGWGRC
jgi:hypothetical protein